VVTIEGIVVGDFQSHGLGSNGDLGGFFVQEEDADADGDASTSEGIFVFEGFDPTADIQVGDKVRITGTVGEFFGEIQLSSLTSVEVISSGNELPMAAEITFPVAGTKVNADGVLIAGQPLRRQCRCRRRSGREQRGTAPGCDRARRLAGQQPDRVRR
jgi:uncharacterized protein